MTDLSEDVVIPGDSASVSSSDRTEETANPSGQTINGSEKSAFLIDFTTPTVVGPEEVSSQVEHNSSVSRVVYCYNN